MRALAPNAWHALGPNASLSGSRVECITVDTRVCVYTVCVERRLFIPYLSTALRSSHPRHVPSPLPLPRNRETSKLQAGKAVSSYLLDSRVATVPSCARKHRDTSAVGKPRRKACLLFSRKQSARVFAGLTPRKTHRGPHNATTRRTAYGASLFLMQRPRLPLCRSIIRLSGTCTRAHLCAHLCAHS